MILCDVTWGKRRGGNRRMILLLRRGTHNNNNKKKMHGRAHARQGIYFCFLVFFCFLFFGTQILFLWGKERFPLFLFSNRLRSHDTDGGPTTVVLMRFLPTHQSATFPSSLFLFSLASFPLCLPFSCFWQLNTFYSVNFFKFNWNVYDYIFILTPADWVVPFVVSALEVSAWCLCVEVCSERVGMWVECVSKRAPPHISAHVLLFSFSQLSRIWLPQQENFGIPKQK